MTWTCKIDATFYKDGLAQATATFTSDDPTKSPMTLTNFGDTFGKQALNDWCYGKLQSLNASGIAFLDLQTVPLGDFTPTKPVAVQTP